MNFKAAQKFCTNFGLQLPMPASIIENNEEGYQNDAWFPISLKWSFWNLVGDKWAFNEEKNVSNFLAANRKYLL